MNRREAVSAGLAGIAAIVTMPEVALASPTEGKPSTSLRDHRENLIRAFTASLDRCIQAQEDRPGAEVTHFEAAIRLDAVKDGKWFEILSTPSVDLTQPYDASFPTTALPVKA